MVGIASLVYVASANTIQEKVKQQHQQETDVRSVCLQVNGYGRKRVDWKGKQVPTCQTRDFRLSGTVSDAT